MTPAPLQPSPLPRVTRWIVTRLAGRGDAESMLADLEEEVEQHRQQHGVWAARTWLWREIARSALPLGRRHIRNAHQSARKAPTMSVRGIVVDLRGVLRRLRRAPGFSLLAIGSLGLGIGAATAIFSLAHAVWLNPLPYAEPDRLVVIDDVHAQSGAQASSSGPEFRDLQRDTSSFTGIAAFSYGAHIARINDEPVRIVAYQITPNLLSVLGATPAMGRGFLDSDVNTPVVVLSHRIWRARFQGDPNIVGKTFQLDGGPYTIIGVMPAPFRFPQALESEIWTASDFKSRMARDSRYLQVIARLRPGVTMARANTELATEATRLAAADPAAAGWTIHAVPLDRSSDGYRSAFGSLLGIVALFLLIACANLASLLVSRNTARRAELALATALGASRWRLVRALFVESLILSGAGGLVGLAFAFEGNRVLSALMPAATPRLADVHISGVVVAFAAAIIVLTAILCAVAPAIGLRSIALSATLTGARSSGPTSQRTQDMLVIVEVALAALLLVGASLMLKNFSALIDRDRGYTPHGVLALNVSLPFSNDRYQAVESRVAAFDEILATVSHVPGVTVVAATTGFPGSALGFLGGGPVTAMDVPGEPAMAGLHNATPDYFTAMDVPIRRGRAFQAADSAAAPSVAIVNEELAGRLWPGREALGQTFRLPATPGMTAGGTVTTVVGIAGDMHMGTRRTPEIFVPLAQTSAYWIDLVVRTNGNPRALATTVRQALRGYSPDLLIENVASLDDIIRDTYGLQRAQSLLTMLVATLAAIMAAMGIYALLTYYVAQHTREMGICLALGSSPRRLFLQVFRRGMALTLAGIVLGMGGAVMAVRSLRGAMFGLDAAGPATYLLVGVSIVALTALVIGWSARRVIRIDPLVAIRQS